MRLLGCLPRPPGAPDLSTLSGGGESSDALVHDVTGPSHRSPAVTKNLFRAYAANSPVRQSSLRRLGAAQKEMILIVNGDESRGLTPRMRLLGGDVQEPYPDRPTLCR